ncbi:MAG: HAMP domain-containing histidine kinase [marine benthic group bacterium]|nr:HAMP domain-containing histidine kinase [Gemmatimonadota bacterium]MCL7966579.1 HAMP domain-containing histidine kinase [Gemmatimonadota bacterium]MCL7971799.1 HAMP domain-containing histidine kinase [Candidatus Benthicola marisminoris]
MSFRLRLLAGSLLLALLPLIAFGLGVRRQVAERIGASFEAQADLVAGTIESRLETEGTTISDRLEALAEEIAADNRLRRAIVREEPSERPYLLDYAGRAMRLTGLSVLQLQDEEGRILSSGHFRAEFDRSDPALPAALETTGATPDEPDGTLPALAPVRTPSGTVLALLRAEPVALGGRRLVLVGGNQVDETALARLAPGDEVTVRLTYPGGTLQAPGTGPVAPDEFVVAREIPVRWAGPNGEEGEARFVVSHSLAPLREVRREIARWFLLAVGLTAAAAIALAAWLSARIGRPLTELARKTERFDLDRLDVYFPSDRRDEIGALSRVLAAMSDRLRVGAARLREAERRATLGEIARQVNHDVKNGLVPIRNVFRHLVEVADREPEALPEVLAERRGTIESGIRYLEGLAANYARLAPRLDLRACDAAAVAREVTAAAEEGDVRLDVNASAGVTEVRADRLVLRRILENLVGNAVDAARAGGGHVTVNLAPAGNGERVRIDVEDDGPGLTPEALARVFEDFFTTKPGGTGLGLSVARRLASDLGGSLKAVSVPGEGSRFSLELPAASEGSAG